MTGRVSRQVPPLMPTAAPGGLESIARCSADASEVVPVQVTLVLPGGTVPLPAGPEPQAVTAHDSAAIESAAAAAA